jgi:hypothetical protein
MISFSRCLMCCWLLTSPLLTLNYVCQRVSEPLLSADQLEAETPSASLSAPHPAENVAEVICH